VCISFLTKREIDNSKINTSGIKIRGVFNTEKEARNYAEEL